MGIALEYLKGLPCTCGRNLNGDIIPLDGEEVCDCCRAVIDVSMLEMQVEQDGEDFRALLPDLDTIRDVVRRTSRLRGFEVAAEHFGWKTVADLAATSQVEMLKLRCFGRATLSAILLALRVTRHADLVQIIENHMTSGVK